MRYIWLLLIAVSSSAQEFGSYGDLPLLAGTTVGPFIPTFPTQGLYLHWVTKDLATNTTIGLWTDEIQGWNWAQSTGAQQAIGSSTGLVFTSSSQNYNATNMSGSVFATLITSFYLIYKVNYFPNGTGSSALFFDVPIGTETFFNFSGGINDWSAAGLGVISGAITTNSITDYFSGKLGAGFAVYTNGISDAAAVSGMAPNTTKLFGMPNGSSIQELAYWTNMQATAIMASNLTAYRRLTYGGQ